MTQTDLQWLNLPFMFGHIREGSEFRKEYWNEVELMKMEHLRYQFSQEVNMKLVQFSPKNFVS